jgi:hypothetical protein
VDLLADVGPHVKLPSSAVGAIDWVRGDAKSRFAAIPARIASGHDVRPASFAGIDGHRSIESRH